MSGASTVFKIWFPADQAAVDPARTAAPAEALPRGNGACILVVDDEAAVRTVA